MDNSEYFSEFRGTADIGWPRTWPASLNAGNNICSVFVVTVHRNLECVIHLIITCRDMKGRSYLHELDPVFQAVMFGASRSTPAGPVTLPLKSYGRLAILERNTTQEIGSGATEHDNQDPSALYSMQPQQHLVMTSWKMTRWALCGPSLCLSNARTCQMYMFSSPEKRAQRGIKLIRNRWCLLVCVWPLFEMSLHDNNWCFAQHCSHTHSVQRRPCT